MSTRRVLRSELQCANPSCWYIVHPDESFGGFCCKKCHWRFESGSTNRRSQKHGERCLHKAAPSGARVAESIPPASPNAGGSTASTGHGRLGFAEERPRSRSPRERSRAGSPSRSRLPLESSREAASSRSVGIRCVEVDKVLFTQTDCSSFFSDGKPLCKLISSLNLGKVNPTVESFMQLDAVEDASGKLWCLNNRRLRCLKNHQDSMRPSIVTVQLRVGEASAIRKYERRCQNITDGISCKIRSPSRSMSRSRSQPARSKSRRASRRRGPRGGRSQRGGCQPPLAADPPLGGRLAGCPSSWEPDSRGRLEYIESCHRLRAAGYASRTSRQRSLPPSSGDSRQVKAEPEPEYAEKNGVVILDSMS